MKNPVIHFELPYHDGARAARFYSTVFGWETQALGEQMGNYIMCTTADADARPGAPAGAINGGLFPFKTDWPAQYPNIVVAVGDIHAAMKSITEAGGKVLGDPMLIPGVGHYVSFFDTEGNRTSVLQPLVG